MMDQQQLNNPQEFLNVKLSGEKSVQNVSVQNVYCLYDEIIPRVYSPKPHAQSDCMRGNEISVSLHLSLLSLNFWFFIFF